MDKEIRYAGHTAAPADYDCPDGDLSVLMDLWPENGTLKPVLKPQEILQLSSQQKVMYLHKVGTSTHYICFDSTNTSLFWINAADGTATHHSMTSTGMNPGDLIRITGIGNTVIALTKAGMRYYLWKDNNYTYLGSEIPDLPISFGLEGEIVRNDDYDMAYLVEQMQSTETELSDANKDAVTEVVMAKVNKFVAENSTNAGKFIFPFFVRYAYRLYDNSLVKHSAPILMLTTNDSAPIVRAYLYHAQGGESPLFHYRVTGVSCKLVYNAESSALVSALQPWSDIVKSVDIFITPPLYTYDQAGKIKRYIDLNTSTDPSADVPRGIFKITNDNISPSGYGSWHQVHCLEALYGMVFTDTSSYTYKKLELPVKKLEDNIESANFYYLKSLPLDGIAHVSTEIPIDDDYLQSLVNREVMTDDYDSNDTLIPQFAFTYNNRINLANLSKNLYPGFSAYAAFEKTSPKRFQTSADVNDPIGINYRVYIRQGGKTVVVSPKSSAQYNDYYGNYSLTPFFYFYYPNTNAYKLSVQITTMGGTVYCQEFLLKQHPYLNGAYYAGKNVNMLTGTATFPTLTDRKISIENKLYTSEVNNPFYYPVTCINTLGSGAIIAICSSTKPLSQGQFGEFPLYAFTEDGIWALEVNTQTGGFSAKQPTSFDVCLGPDSVAQIDRDVMFATNKGIMLLSGGNVTCLSDYINNKEDEVFSLSLLPQAANLLLTQSGDPAFTFVSFQTYLQGSHMMYDYTSNRVIVYNPSYSYAYIYSINAKSWGMMRSNIASYVNSYPETLAMTSDNKLVDFSKRIANQTPTNQVLVTRPLKLDLNDVLKTVTSIIQRGRFNTGDVKTLLYGSRDLINWFPVWSSNDHYLRGFRGTPYKYFRIALKCALSDHEDVSGCSISFDTRQTNQPR